MIVEVTDQGGGIPDEIQARLFQPGVSTRAGGSGVGLAISQLLARQIEAVLAVTETGPHGTTFALTLPQTPLTSPPAKSPGG